MFLLPSLLYQLFLATLLAGLSNAPWYNHGITHSTTTTVLTSLSGHAKDYLSLQSPVWTLYGQESFKLLGTGLPSVVYTETPLYNIGSPQDTRVLSHLFSLCQQPVFVSLLRQSESHLGLCFTGLASPVVMWCFITSVLPTCISWPPRLRTLLNTSWLEPLTRFVHCLYFL